MDFLDRIVLRGLRVRGNHGVFEFEREQGQDFVVDITLHLRLRAAAASDDVADTVHYGELADQVAAIVGGEPVNLIETLAERIAEAVLGDERVHTVEVTVHKPQAPIDQTFDDVAVTILRGRP
ncbi:dihydroneopterin aldolase [Microbacterium sp.]|uniref:dihydroneopterin aldolase n=1 Tax=Microbacterium sp. TaxID=51671 RepID=UPI0037CA10CF